MGGREKSYITFEKSYSAPDLPMVVVGKCMGVLALCMGGREESYIVIEKSYSAPDLPMVVVGKCMGVLALCMGGSNSKGREKANCSSLPLLFTDQPESIIHPTQS